MDININLKLFSFSWKITIAKPWVQFGIIAAVVLASIIVSFWGSTRMLVLALALLGGVVVTLVLTRQPNIGFILILLGGMFVPYSGPSGLNAAVLMAAVMLGLWILEMLVIKRQFILVRSAVILPAMVFLAISILSFVMGQIPWFLFAQQAPIAAQAGGFAIFVFSIGVMLSAAHLIKDIRWLKIIVWVFIGLGAFYVLGRVVNFQYNDRLYQSGALGSMFWTWLVALSFSQVVYNNKLKLRAKGLLISIVLLTFYVAVVQGYDWKSGWVPPLAAASVLLGIRYRKIVVFGIPFIAIAAVYITLDQISSDNYSWGTRVDAWRIILEISRVSPLLGMGFSNYYWYTPLFPIRGWHVVFNSHSQYVDLIAQTGFLGLISFIWLFLAIGRLAWNLTKQFPDGFSRSYLYGVIAGIVATMAAAFLGDWVLPFVYNVGLTGFRSSILPWIFLGGVVAIEQLLLNNPKSQ
jgi:O-antigen ligase